MTDPRQRFSDCASAYARGRPGYPPAVLDLLLGELGVGPGRIVAELGAGAGAFTELLADTGATVVAIEPSATMREQAARRLGDRTNLTIAEGSAEHTGVAAGAVDLVAAAQAFHWFEPVATMAELRRILRPDGRVVLLWNSRRLTGALMAGLEAALRRHGERYDQIGHAGEARDDRVERFFAPAPVTRASVANPHPLDAAGYAAYIASISYLPKPGQPGHPAMLADMQALFADHAVDGVVVIEHDTLLFHAALPGT